VLSGRGRVKVDDEIVDVGPLDAIRVAPRSTRAFEAGDEALEPQPEAAEPEGGVDAEEPVAEGDEAQEPAS
jgi:mannose-6-phosphate isomerase-like protein (cupin superfamily)